MKKVITAVVMACVLATVSSSKGSGTVSAFTGVDANMPWNQFVEQMDRSASSKAAFVANLELAALGTAPTVESLAFLTTPNATTFAAMMGVDANAPSEAALGVLLSPGTLNLTADKTLTVPKTMTFTSTDDTTVATFFAGADTVVGLAATQELTNKTLTAPVIKTGLTASGSAANTFAGSTGTFITSTGANTLNGAVSINAATTPSLTLATGKTNTGFIDILGKTSGGLRLTVADASAYLVTTTMAAQTSGTAALTIPDFAGVADEFTFKTKSQTMANKTLTSPVIATGLTASGSAANTFAASTGAFITSTGTTTISGALASTSDTWSGAGAVPIITLVTKLTCGAGPDAMTLANGVDGQIKVIVLDVDGGSAVLTPATKTGFSTFTFTNAGDAVTLVYVTTRGWMIIGSHGGTIG